MESLVTIQKRIIPDFIDVMQKRFQVLQHVHALQPIGRRALSDRVGLTERVLRSEVDFLKEQHLLCVSKIGISLTDAGEQLLHQMEDVMRAITGTDRLEAELKKLLRATEVVVVPGDVDESPWLKKELGRISADILAGQLDENDIIAVTGGTTMVAVAENLSNEFQKKQALFVPARGAIGEDVKNQANTICAKMAEVSGAAYRVLYIPDQVSESMYESIVQEPSISEVLELISQASIVLHGIGDAKLMAKRRNTEQVNLERLIKDKATGEAFGYYFDESGRIVDKVQTVGLQLDDLLQARTIVAVAGGTSKAKAIQAYMNQAPSSTILVTDEGAARAIINNHAN